MTLQKLLDRLGPVTKIRVLILACYIGGEDVQFWLRRGVAALDGVDVYDLTATWQAVTPVLAARWGRSLCFQQASVEQLPFVDESFDLIFSDAVMEHLRNLRAAAREMARVLKPGRNGTAQLRAALHNIRRRPLHCGFWRRSRLIAARGNRISQQAG